MCGLRRKAGKTIGELYCFVSYQVESEAKSSALVVLNPKSRYAVSFVLLNVEGSKLTLTAVNYMSMVGNLAEK